MMVRVHASHAMTCAHWDVMDHLFCTAGDVIGQPYGKIQSDVPVPLIQHGLQRLLNVRLIMNPRILLIAVTQVTYGIPPRQHV